MIELLTRPPIVLMVVLGLSACAMAPREGPPAPVVQVTPHLSAPVAAPEPVREAAPLPAKPAAPAKPKTTVYAYRDPGAPPEPEPAASATAPVQPAVPNVVQSAPAPAFRPAPATPVPSAAPAVAKATPPQEIQAPAALSAPMPATLSKPVQPPAPPVAKTEPKPPPLPGATLPRAETAQSERKAPRAATAPPIAAPSLPPAAQSLASQAEQQRQSGDYAGAAASLERSLRINAPLEGKAYLLNRLARVRMEQGQASQAASFAARSNDLVGENAIVKKDNWRIIAESRRRAGETDAAAEAERRAGGD